MGGSPPPPNCDQDDDQKFIIVTAQLNQLDGNMTFESDSSSSSMINGNKTADSKILSITDLMFRGMIIK